MFSALSYYKYTQVTILYDLRCNAGGARSIKVSMARGRGRSTTLNCTCA